jgi:ribonuclease P protein component
VAAVPSSVLAAPKAVIASRSDADRSDTARPVRRRASLSFRASFDMARIVAGEAKPSGLRDAGYPRAARMATPAEFDRVLRRPALFRSGPFALHLEWIVPMNDAASGGTAAPDWRLGLVIPKRYEASAVARNTIKRRWRDAFRRGRSAWAAEFGSADVVVRLQGQLVPKAAKATVRNAPKAPPIAMLPARVRARDRFDPFALLSAFVDRLRSRGGRPAVVAGAGET